MAIFNVSNTNDIGKGSLRQAILDANALTGKDIINFDGVFVDKIADTITLGGSSLNITDDLSIEGTGANLLTVSGNNASRVFDIGSGITVEIDGLTIANGYTPDAINYDYYSEAEYNGAGIRNYGALTLNNSTISGNRAGLYAGGIYNGGTITLSNSTISDNSATSGGGILNAGIFTVNNTTINSNKAKYGGGISNGGTMTVSNSTISGNSASGSGELYDDDNRGSINNGGDLTVSNSTISGNSADGIISGGIGSGNTTLFVNNSTISGNSGYGINNFGIRDGFVELNNSTIIGNSGDIYNSELSNGFTVNNSILSSAFGNFTSNGSNLIGNFDGNRGFSFREKLNGPLMDLLDTTLRDNGGPVKTHALVYGSLAINAGINADVPVDTTDLDSDGNTTEQIPFDGRGSSFPRISDGQVDIGAFEAVENVINGTATSDTINGTAANDIITGYRGRDILSGGLGANAFVYTSISDLGDTISDFEAGRDKIVLQQLFKSLNLGNLNYASAISGGYLGFETQGSGTVVLIDPDGSAGLGRSVKLLTVLNVSATALNNAANFVFSLPAPPTPSTSIFTVTNTNNSGSGSLRQAIEDANASFGKDIIKFDGVFADDIPDTIGGGLVIRDDLSIVAPGANLLTISGGNIEIEVGASVDIAGLTIADSRSFSDDFYAGRGIFNYGSLTLINSTIRDNSGQNGGGIFNDRGATLTINNSTISDNTSDFEGGGISNYGTLTVNNSTISNNRAGVLYSSSGGGIANSGTLVINNSTITGNTTGSNDEYDDFGATIAGIYGNNIIVNNSIIAGNFYIPYNNPANTINKDVGGNFTSNGHNLIGSLNNSKGFNANEQLNVPLTDVLDTTLRDNGGATKTHALVSGSPAINAGLNASTPPDTADLDGDGNTTEPVPYDQRGVGYQRISDGTVDIGAVEGVVNVIYGTSNADIIKGTAGNDTIIGYQGQDIITGGAGADAFVYTNIRDLGDTIADFEVGTDEIVLGQLFASFKRSDLNYTSAVSGGYLSFETQGSDTTILIDPDSSSGQGRKVKLVKINNVAATDLNKINTFAF
ncbi:choice-of-anchor Q domain-containing protein [Nostoc sp. UHCC 0302]|uniref:beta strand repeat-containing protein n=1 Tax=Nostoc sp. UHCC 0302 TaxID=3134896 RepID=UPI00311CD2BC